MADGWLVGRVQNVTPLLGRVNDIIYSLPGTLLVSEDGRGGANQVKRQEIFGPCAIIGGRRQR